MQQGVGPFDARLANIRASCQPTITSPPSTSPSETAQINEKSKYIVEGLALDSQVALNSNVYKSYECSPSEQYNGLTWCQRKVNELSPSGPIRSSYTIMHSANGTALYINRELDPAFFGLGEADREVARLSARFGSEPRLMKMPAAAEHSYHNGIMALWGSVSLESLDSNSRGQLAIGKSPRQGILIDYIEDFEQSARQGLPLFRISGGEGFVWVASFDQSGRGRLRFFAIDVPTINSLTDHSGPPATGPSQPADPWKDCQSSDTETRLKGCTVIIEAKGSGSKTRLADALDGRCHSLNELQKYQEAIADCLAAIDANPRYSYAYGNLANAYLRLQEYSRSVAASDKAIALKTDSIWSRLTRAEALEVLGKNADALGDYRYALLIDPSNKRAQEGLVRLQRRTSSPPEPCTLELPPDGAENPATNPSSSRQFRSLDAITKAIDAVTEYVSRLHSTSHRYSDVSARQNAELEKRRAELSNRLTEDRKLVSDVQKLAEALTEAQSKLADVSDELNRLQQRLEALKHSKKAAAASRVLTQRLR